MRILYLGEIGLGQTALMRMNALRRLGHEVRGIHTIQPWRDASWLSRQLQRRLNHGPIIQQINAAVRAAATEMNPDVVWADKQEYLSIETIEALRKRGALTVHFTPDPYFTLPWKRTRMMDAAMRTFDVLVYCKEYERQNYEALGKIAIYMPLGFCDESHRPVDLGDPRWTCEVGFLGGWEPRRQRMLRSVSAAGVNLKFRGDNWDFIRDGRWTPRRQIILSQLAAGERLRIRRDDVLEPHWQGQEVYGDDYARALTGAHIGLGFLRKVCPDQHTTRSFEIPACGSMLLADRTDEHRALFEESKEADFFDSSEEMLDKVKYYTANPAICRRIAEAGFHRCMTAQYAYIYRLQSVLTQLNQA